MTSILIATSDRSAGGIQRALRDQLSLLQQHAPYDITILAPESDFLTCAQDNQVPNICLSDWQRLVWRHLPVATRLISDVPDTRFALCHNGFMAKGLRRHASTVIGICHNDKPQQFHHCHKLVCLTQDGIDKALAAGWPHDRLALIPHFHTLPKTPLKTPAKPSPNQPLIIGAAGRMVAKKNLSLFIKIAAIVKQTHPRIQFELGGTGPLAAEIKALNHAHGAPVTLLGWTDFDSFLSRLSVMVIPSYDEPFGYVYPEAMGAGCAILSSPTNGARHCLDDGRTAPVFGFDDPVPYAKEICRLADDPDALWQLQQACYDRARHPVFDQKTASANWQALLDSPL
ncbi:MAG: glycosyltransferase family 4 protein [Candidatus Puniceispirillaceae bacterium]